MMNVVISLRETGRVVPWYAIAWDPAREMKRFLRARNYLKPICTWTAAARASLLAGVRRVL